MSLEQAIRALASAYALLAAVSLPRAVWAQDTFTLERFLPSPAGDRFLGVESPFVAGNFALHAELLADYALRPLILRAPPADAKALVFNQAVLHANLSLALNQRLLLNLDVPGVALQNGDTTPQLHGVDFGDVRWGGRARLLGDNGEPLQFGLGGYLWLPSATGATTGDGQVRGMPYVALGGLIGQVLWSTQAGVEFRPSRVYAGTVHEGSSLDFGVGLAYLVDEQRRIQLGLESTLSFVLAKPAARNLNAELLFAGRYRFSNGLELGAGIGPGLTRAVGTPALRALALLAYVPVADLRPPAAAALILNPPVSADGLSERSLRIAQLQNAPAAPRCCSVSPTAAASELRRARGGSAPPADGILFDTASAEVDARAERAIHAVADYLIAHPEIRRVELCGYADIHGTVESNQRLGARRAEAVKQALIRHSVSPERLVSKSYGATELTASSTSSAGMHQNRRVVIRVLEPDTGSAPAAVP